MLHRIKNLTLIYLVCLLSFSITPVISNGATAFVDTIIGSQKQCNFVNDGLYKPFSDIDNQFPVFGELIQGNNRCVKVSNSVPDLFDTGFKVFLGIVSLLAVVRISYAGIQWMIQDKSGAKTNAREMLTNSIIGLVLALSAWLILNTVNPRALNLSTLSLQTGALSSLGGLIQSGINQAEGNIAQLGSGGCIQGTTGCTSGGTLNGGAVDPATLARYSGATDVNTLLSSAQNASQRSTDGGLNFSLYSSTGDNTTDSNTSAGRGNNNNLLTAGSVALSPDLVNTFRAQGMRNGQAIQVNGVTVGYWDDTTSSSFVNTIDLYNPGNMYGNTNSFLRTIPAGGYQVTLGSEVRTQIRNP